MKEREGREGKEGKEERRIWRKGNYILLTWQWLIEEMEWEGEHREQEINGGMSEFLKVHHPPENQNKNNTNWEEVGKPHAYLKGGAGQGRMSFSASTK